MAADAPVVRFSASKVALVTGLHEFGDPAEELLACIYQDRDELLACDAARLQLRLVSKADELEALVCKSGSAAAPQLRAALRWSSDRATPARVGAAQRLLAGVDQRLAEAQAAKTLGRDEAIETRRLLAEKIHTSVGIRNERLALQAYERQTGSTVRLTNEQFYFLTFPSPPPAADGAVIDYRLLDGQSRRTVAPARRSRRTREATAAVDVDEAQESGGFFSICGMVDGVADLLTISADDEWTLTPVVVEVKNRVRSFRSPPPLYDQVQLAVYMKMLGLEQGDLVQCLYGASTQPAIQVSRVALDAAPLRDFLSPAASLSEGQSQTEDKDLWTAVIVPRLYAFTAAVQKLREEELLRLSFLNGSEEERHVMLRAECEFL
ncbi:hypothetical protein BBJ28_00015714 [Nothophytophthora sp. Chile5]|nr:hypothetical protein BBJ28_00015714 [Nothophytophthora sp. Chile5]